MVGNYMELIYPEFLRFKDRVCGTLDRILCQSIGNQQTHRTVNAALLSTAGAAPASGTIRDLAARVFIVIRNQGNTPP